MSSSSETMAPPQPETQKVPDGTAEHGETPITDEQLRSIVEGDSESLGRGAVAVKKLSEGAMRAGSDYGTTTEVTAKVATEMGVTEELAANDSRAEQIVEDFGRDSSAVVAEGREEPVADIAESPEAPVPSQVHVDTSSEGNPMDIARQASEVVSESQTETTIQETTETVTEAQDTSEKEKSPRMVERIAYLQEKVREYSQFIIKEKLGIEAEKKGEDLTEAEIEKITTEVSKTLTYFETVDASMSPETPLARVASIYEGLGDVDQASVEAHMQLVIESAFDQQMDNPEQYCSHGFDHTLTVAEYTQHIAENNPEVVSRVEEQYGVTEAEAKFLLQEVALFHDFGYPTVGKRSKAVHGITGAGIIGSDESLGSLLGSGDKVGLIKVDDPDKREALAHDLRDAVLFHSADKVESRFSTKVILRRGEFLTSSGGVDEVISTFAARDAETGAPSEESIEVQVARGEEVTAWADLVSMREITGMPFVIKVVDGDIESLDPPEEPDANARVITLRINEEDFSGRKVDLQDKDDDMIGLEYSEVDLLEEPLQGVIRVADNMDMRKVRLSEIQLDPVFREIYEAFGDGGDVSTVLSSLESAAKDWRALSEGESARDSKIVDAEDAVMEFCKAKIVELTTKKASLGGPLAGLEFSEEEIGKIKNPKDAAELLKRKVVEAILAEARDKDSGVEYSDEQKENIRRISLLQGSESIRHFDGCMAITSVELQGSEVTVTVVRAEYERLNKLPKAKESTEDSSGVTTVAAVDIGEYQIWRARQAYGSIKVGKEPLTVKVVDTDGQVIEASTGVKEQKDD